MQVSPSTLALLFIPLALACFALSPATDAQCPQICDSNANTAVGGSALISDTTGQNNTAVGYLAISSNTTGNDNTAIGSNALRDTIGFESTAIGSQALFNSTTASGNTAVGFQSLFSNTAGSNNIALGFQAGFDLTTGSNNIVIGARGIGRESNTIRIGTRGTQRATHIAGISGAIVATGVPVIIDTGGHLGTTTSSARFKEEIKSMDKASEAILALKPVTFRYKHDLDPDGVPQFGLVAEEVEKVNPELVAHDDDGKPYTVRYEAVNAMLLNEFLKEHREVQEQKATIAELKNQIADLIERVKRQSSQIHKVSAQIELIKPTPQTVSR